MQKLFKTAVLSLCLCLGVSACGGGVSEEISGEQAEPEQAVHRMTEEQLADLKKFPKAFLTCAAEVAQNAYNVPCVVWEKKELGEEALFVQEAIPYRGLAETSWYIGDFQKAFFLSGGFRALFTKHYKGLAHINNVPRASMSDEDGQVYDGFMACAQKTGVSFPGQAWPPSSTGSAPGMQ